MATAVNVTPVIGGVELAVRYMTSALPGSLHLGRADRGDVSAESVKKLAVSSVYEFRALRVICPK
jgi:hypothetical protein